MSESTIEGSRGENSREFLSLPQESKIPSQFQNREIHRKKGKCNKKTTEGPLRILRSGSSGGMGGTSYRTGGGMSKESRKR